MEKREDYMDQLISYLRERVTLSREDEQHIRSAFHLQIMKKKEFFFKEGKVANLEAFVVSGTFRIFNTDTKGLEHVLYFAFANWWIGDITSFYSNEPSALNAQALEESTILAIDKNRKEELFQKVPSLERLFRILVQNHLAVLQKRFLLTVSSSAEERYVELIERCTGIEQMVPQHQIASYLGILPESLSRMKKQMNERAKKNSSI